MQDRFLRFDGAINLRDVGGYATAQGWRVREGQVYRSGSLAYLSNDGVRALGGLGLAEVWDLRSHEEVAKHPDRLPDGVAYRHRPLANPGRGFRLRALWAVLSRRPHRLTEMLYAGYTQVTLIQNAAVVADFFRAVSEAETPVLLHCTAGKDRTGIFVALLLDLLGVPRSTIYEDYVLSNEYHASFVKAIEDDLRRLRRLRINETHLAPLLVVEPEMMERVLNFVDEMYGSTEDYLREVGGLSAESIAKIRSTLLEK